MQYRYMHPAGWMLVIFILVMPGALYAGNPPALISVESPYGMDKTIAVIKQSLVSNNFRFLREQAVAEGVTEFADPDFRILYFCNFSLAYKAIQSEKRIGFMLPCRLTVARVGNKVTIHYLNPEYAKNMVGGSLEGICDQITIAFNNIIDEVIM